MKYGKGDAAVVVNVATSAALFQALRARFAKGQGFALATLNLDHLTKLPGDPGFAAAYHAQDLIVADGRPVVWLSQLAKQPVALMPGSDLIIPLCELAAEQSLPIALVMRKPFTGPQQPCGPVCRGWRFATSPPRRWALTPKAPKRIPPCATSPTAGRVCVFWH